MLRRRLVLLAAVLVAVLCAGTTHLRASAQTTTERVVATPGEGMLQTRFVFTGSGFVPGRTVSVRVLTPEGERRFTNEQGVEFVWLVGPDGTFTLDFVPAQHFPGSSPGRWRALFCTHGALTCQLVDFDLLQ